MDWMDLKEMEETDWGGDDPYDDEDGDGDGHDEDSEGRANGNRGKEAGKLKEETTVRT